MLQRVQSIWLLLAALCAFAGLKFPFYSGITKTAEMQYSLNGTHNLLFTVVTVAVGLLSLVAIFLYKNRSTQIKIAVVALVLQCLLIYMYYNRIQNIFVTSADNTYALWAIFQVGAVILLILAIAGIRRDSKIIADSNRLR